MVSWKFFLGNVIIIFKNKGFDFSHISQMNIITVFTKMDMTNGFYMNHNVHAVEWKLNNLINKGKKSINKLTATWVRLLNRKFESYRV